MKNNLFIHKRFAAIIAFASLIAFVQAQQVIVKGKITDSKEALTGSNIRVKGTNIGASAQEGGVFELKLQPGTYTLVASFVGYDSQEKEIKLEAGSTQTLDFVLPESQLSEVVMLGSRALPRSRLETTVPVDIIDGKVLRDVPQLS